MKKREHHTKQYQEKSEPENGYSHKVPISGINSCICLYTTTDCDSASTRYVAIQSTNNPNSESVIETKWISYS